MIGNAWVPRFSFVEVELNLLFKPCGGISREIRCREVSRLIASNVQHFLFDDIIQKDTFVEFF